MKRFAVGHGRWLRRKRGAADVDAADAELLACLEAEFDADPDAFIEGSQRPTGKDFQLIGTLIQAYCFAEHSARQVIDLIEVAAFGRDGNGSRLAPHDVFPKLEEVAQLLKESSLKETLVRASGTMDMHRKHRHTFAHWIVRRVRGGKAFLVLSNNAQEGKKRHGKMITSGEANYGIFATATLMREVKKLEQHTQNLSLAAAFMADQPTSLKNLIALEHFARAN